MSSSLLYFKYNYNLVFHGFENAKETFEFYNFI